MGRRWALCGCAALVAICWSRLAAAYRPFDGTDADVAEPGEVELELGPVGYQQRGSSRFLVAPALVANYGFSRDFEAVLEGRQAIPLSTTRRSPQLQDVAVSVKSVLRRGSLQGGNGLSVALELGMLLPGFEHRLGTHLGSIFSLQLPAITLHLNVGNDILYSAHYEANASLILEGPAAWRLRPVAEVLVRREFTRGDLADGLGERALIGGVVRWSDALSFDVAGLLGRAEGEREVEARVGLTWAFEP